MTGEEWRRVLRLRLRAWRTGSPVPDFERGVSYWPDGSVHPAKAYPTLAALLAARAQRAAEVAAFEEKMNHG